MDHVILIADDDEDVLISAKYALDTEYPEIITTTNPRHIPELCNEKDIALALLDMNFSPGKREGEEGLALLEKIKEASPETVVILMTAFGDVELAIKGIKAGAFDFIMKPWKNAKLRASVRSGIRFCDANLKLKHSRQTIETYETDIGKDFTDMIGHSAAMQKVKQSVSMIAPTDANVLILGENGTGKELVARELHRQSDRSTKPFISVDLGALNENLFESELFGHTKGAFTGAVSDKAGRFKLANEGTIFLDEIGNLPIHLQSKMLTVLERRTLTPVGAVKEIPVDIRLICATNMPLRQMTDDQKFRKDLYYRINTFEVDMPPLRDRADDISDLVTFFLLMYTKKYRKKYVKPGKQVIAELKRYHWPGNIRELRNLAERAVVLSAGESLEPSKLLESGFHDVADTRKELNLESNEKSLIKKALTLNTGNVTQAARDLGIDRNALYRRIKKYGI